MARKRKSIATRSYIGPILLSLFCFFAWIAILTFDVGDWPNPSHYPHHEPAVNACGRAGSLVAYGLFYWLGDGAYPLLLFSSLGAALWLVNGKIVDLLQRSFGLALLVGCTSATIYLVAPEGARSLAVGNGGILGTAIGGFLNHTFSGFGSALVLIYSFFVGMLFAAEGWVLRFPGAVQRIREMSGEALTAARTAVANAIPSAVPAAATSAGPAVSEPRALTGRPQPELRINPGRPVGNDEKIGGHQQELPFKDAEVAVVKAEPKVAEPKVKGPAEPGKRPLPDDEPEDDEIVAAVDVPVRPEPLIRHPQLQPPPPLEKAYPTLVDSWDFPNLDMLREPEGNFNAQQESIVRAKAHLLEQTLEEFRLDAHVVEIDTGPVITMFELQLGAGVKVSQVASLANDVARALKAPAVRVVAPIPGKNTVGIEVPNVDKEKVRLKELIALSAAKLQKMALPLFLGKDASGAVLLADLAAMPHMLIAGTTGSGKSVCINSIIASILMTKKPDEAKLILVDPKMVEMSQFKDVPHLMSPIITDMNRAEQILDWAVTKMEERYELLAEARVRNLATYNKLDEEELYRRFQPTTEQEKAQIPKRLPYIVVIIDELADLMMTAAKEVEHHLARLAQKSRAVGIHIVVATQRPEAKVVTGLIKSNMPCRCAFRVASRMDSRIVLDQNGAEVLMGQGDMLFLPPGSHKLVRAQGTLLEDDELHNIIEFLTAQSPPEFHPQLMRIKAKGLDGSTERDPLFDQAVRIVLESQRGSVSLLQRRLSVGYSRASRLIDEMAEAGVVGDFKGSQAREVVMTLDEWESMQIKAALAPGAPGNTPPPAPDEVIDEDIDDEYEEDEPEES